MGFVLSVLYLVTYYLTPAAMFGPLAPFRIELILAALVFFVSLPALMKSFLGKTPQTLAVIGLAIASFMSVLVGQHWVGGAVGAFLAFIPNAFAYFLVCLHCNSKKKLQVLVLMLLFVCLFVIGRGSLDLARGIPQSEDTVSGSSTGSPYFLAMHSDSGEMIVRLRGLGEINDPNDFAQLIVCLIPLLFIFWRAKRTLLNLLCVILPIGILLYGAFLTHSRGAVIALLATLVVAGRRKIGILPSLVVAGLLFVGASLINFTGGRDISAGSGADRISLWGQGLQLLREHPLFGVGFGSMAEFTDVHLTAHNSIVVCAAELGFFGLFFWCLLLLPSVVDSLRLSSPDQVTEGEPIPLEEGLFPGAVKKVDEIDKSEINRMGQLMVASFTGFLVAGMFLSRAYALTLFLLAGMAEVVYEMALQRQMIAPRMKFVRVLFYAAGLAVAFVPLMYITVIVLNRLR
jgi:O-antigen ligase